MVYALAIRHIRQITRGINQTPQGSFAAQSVLRVIPPWPNLRLAQRHIVRQSPTVPIRLEYVGDRQASLRR